MSRTGPPLEGPRHQAKAALKDVQSLWNTTGEFDDDPIQKHRRKAPIRHRWSTAERLDFLERDGGSCWICGCSIDPTLPIDDPLSHTLDHIKPLFRGGSDRPENLRSAHKLCNKDRGSPRGESND
jgi:5-methylcytosine-specific restriction endonuclease McrA